VPLFVGNDVDPEWRGVRRPPGRYVSTGWIPGNFLAEGAIWVGAHIMTLAPEKWRCGVPDVVMFRVVDPLEAKDTARGDYTRPLLGVMRPLLRWTTKTYDAEHTAIHCLADPRALELARLVNRVTVGKNHGEPPLAAIPDRFERGGVETAGEWIVEQVAGQSQYAWIVLQVQPQALHGAEVVGVTQCRAQLFEVSPIPRGLPGAERVSQVRIEIVVHAVVVQQRVVAIEEENDVISGFHRVHDTILPADEFMIPGRWQNR